MSLPRHPAAGRQVDETFRGVDAIGGAKKGHWTVRVDALGAIRDIRDSRLHESSVHDLRDALNAAMKTVLASLETTWWEFGMPLRDVLNEGIYFRPSLEILRILEECRISLGQNFVMNAVPAFREDPPEDDDGLYHLYENDPFAVALSYRTQVLDMVRAHDPLNHDIDTFRWFRQNIEGYAKTRRVTFDANRLCILMPVGRDGNRHFVNSVGQLLMQARQAGKSVDLLLGLNQVDYPEEIRALNGERIEVTNLYVNEDISNGLQDHHPLFLAEDVFRSPSLQDSKFVIDNPRCEDHRIFAIRQRKTAWNAGKNPLQGVLVRMLFDRLMQGGERVPSQILLADADSWFIAPQAEKATNMDLLTNGLQELLREKEERGLTMIGARGTSALFDERGGQRIPHFDLPVPPIYQLLDEGGRCMVGGGTLGDFTTVLSLLAIVCHRYPGSRTEDAHYTALAHRAEVKWGIAERAHVSNEVHENSLEQLKRWFSGAHGIRKLYRGQNAFEGIFDADAVRQKRSGEGWREALQTYEELVTYGRENPDDVYGGDASWDA